MLKVGTFYHAYGKDSYILSYLFNYQLKRVESNYSTCCFPKSSINKVKAALKEQQINYVLVNRSENYEVEEKEEYKNNKYMEYYNIAQKYVTRKNRINEIYDCLIENINNDKIKEKITRIEKVLCAV